MGNAQCHLKKKKIFDPGAVLDRVIAGAGPEDECLLYKLANFKKGVGGSQSQLLFVLLTAQGQLVEAFTGTPGPDGTPAVGGGSKEVEKLIKSQLGGLMYNGVGNARVH